MLSKLTSFFYADILNKHFRIEDKHTYTRWLFTWYYCLWH